jgi:hypothetical protein
MGRLFGIVLVLGAIYVGMTIYAEGLENAFGGAFAPIEPIDQGEEPLATHLTPAAQMADAPTERRRRVPVTQAVRERVNSHMETGARRRGY